MGPWVCVEPRNSWWFYAWVWIHKTKTWEQLSCVSVDGASLAKGLAWKKQHGDVVQLGAEALYVWPDVSDNSVEQKIGHWMYDDRCHLGSRVQHGEQDEKHG